MSYTPDNIVVGSASLTVDGVNVGLTQGGVTLRKSTEFVDVDADQLGGVARKVATFERMFLSTTLLEATLANLHKAMNEPSANLVSGSRLNLGSATPEAVEHTLVVVGKGPSGAVRTWTFYRAIIVEDVEHLAGSRESASSIPVGFELLKDTDNDNLFGYCE